MRTLNILKAVSTVVAASAVAVIATGGKASAINFTLGGPTSTAPNFTYNNSGVNLTATGSARLVTINGPVVPNVQVNRLSNGLGVSSLNVANSDDPEIDGVATFETLRLNFDKLVKLTSVTFARVGFIGVGTSAFATDNYRLRVDGTTVVPNAVIPGANAQDTGIGTLAFNTQFGNNFDFTVPFPTDDYIVSSVSVQAVPEPITIAAMVMGSGFGVLLYRKYKKGAQFSSKLSS